MVPSRIGTWHYYSALAVDRDHGMPDNKIVKRDGEIYDQSI